MKSIDLIEKIKKIKIDINLSLVLVTALILRFVNLGYSDFQGDEIKALFLPVSSRTIGQFLLEQRKGPVQFFVTFIIKLLDPYYTNQFLVRLPFAIAGFAAVYFFYKLIKLHFGEKIAFYASMLLATNGFFVAFSRIAQYQSFVILFCVLCLYSLTLATHNSRYKVKGIYLAALFWAFAILSHYDGIFILPAALMLLVQWIRKVDLPLKHKRKTLTFAFLLFTALNLLFYVPFALYLSQDTKDYWIGRLSGAVSDKISSSYYLFTVYQPIYVIHFYIGFIAIGFIALLLALCPKLVEKILTKIILIRTLLKHAKELFTQTVGLPKFFTLLFWFAVPFMFWEKVVYIPGTHIYTYLIPAFVLVGVGINYVELLWNDYSSKIKFIKPALIKNFVLGVFFIFLFLQSYAIYVDASAEYPWHEEKFLLWTMTQPTPIYHLSMFGFPYFRDWESISRFITSHPEVTAYSTNERESIARYYIKLDKDTDKAGFFVFIKHPQSFTNQILNEKVLYWANNHSPVYTLSKDGNDLVDIYLMPQGTLQEIQAKGF